MRTGTSSERHIAFPSIPRSENAPSRKHMYSIDMYYNTYLEYYSRLSQTCILNMPIIHLLSRTEQFREVNPEYGATSDRYSVRKDHPLENSPNPSYVSTHILLIQRPKKKKPNSKRFSMTQSKQSCTYPAAPQQRSSWTRLAIYQWNTP